MDAALIALGLSLKVALWATLIDLVLGVGFGYLLARAASPAAICWTPCSRCRW
jgi:molybdate transport system permease protein